MKSQLNGLTILITGASRGIGREFVLSLAKSNCNFILCAKTLTPHPKLKGTLEDVANEVIKLGSSCLPCQVDIRNEENIKAAINAAKEKYGKIDILINNASAIELKDTAHIEPKKYDLIHEINFLGTYAVTKHALPYLLASKNGRVINISPPLNLDKKWFVNHTAYTQSKYSMSLLTLGLSQEYKNKLCSNSLWPKTAIYTAAMEMIAGPDCKPLCRKPSIMADALLEILNQDTKLSGQFYVDEEVLRKRGENCFKKYAYFPDKEGEIMKDFYID